MNTPYDTETPRDPIIPLVDAARRLGIHPSTARRMAAKGQFPGVLPKWGGHWRVNARILEEYLSQGATPLDHDADSSQQSA